MDTLPGGEYHESFEKCVAPAHLSAAVRDRVSAPEDAPVLDFVWEELKDWCGFGGLRQANTMPKNFSDTETTATAVFVEELP